MRAPWQLRLLLRTAPTLSVPCLRRLRTLSPQRLLLLLLLLWMQVELLQ